MFGDGLLLPADGAANTISINFPKMCGSMLYLVW